MEPFDYGGLRVGDYVSWRNHDPNHPEFGLWRITRLGIYNPVDKREPLEAGVKLQWICGWRMYRDQRKAVRRLREIRFVGDVRFPAVYGKLRARAFFEKLAEV